MMLTFFTALTMSLLMPGPEDGACPDERALMMKLLASRAGAAQAVQQLEALDDDAWHRVACSALTTQAKAREIAPGLPVLLVAVEKHLTAEHPSWVEIQHRPLLVCLDRVLAKVGNNGGLEAWQIRLGLISALEKLPPLPANADRAKLIESLAGVLELRVGAVGRGRPAPGGTAHLGWLVSETSRTTWRLVHRVSSGELSGRLDDPETLRAWADRHRREVTASK